jgi:hypothetical protein
MDGNPAETPCDGADMRRRLDWPDAQLLGECAVHAYKASGPGGQHRNKVSSAIRLQHGPSGLTAHADESRSQHANKAAALKRLREKIAISFRVPLPADVAWPENVHVVDRRLRVAASNPSLPHVLALCLDALAAAEGRPAGAGEKLGVSSSSLTRCLAAHPAALAEANRIRAAHGHGPLRT